MRAAALIGLLLLAIGQAGGYAQGSAPAFEVRLDDPRMILRAELVITDAAQPPLAAADWRPVSLPDVWRSEARWRQGISGWYRLRLPDGVPSEPQAAYLWRFSMNVAAYFNGEPVGDGGSFDEPVARNWNRPMLFDLPRALWRPSGNELLLRLRVYPGFGHMMPVAVGPTALLAPDYQRRHFAQITTNQVSAIVMLLSALAALGLWLLDRSDRTQLFFAGVCACSMVYALNKFVQYPPTPAHAWWWLVHACVDASAVCLVGFVHRALGEPRPRLERSLAAALLLVLVLYAAWDLPTLARFNPMTHALATLANLYLLVWLGLRFAQRRDSESALYGALMLGLVGVGSYDLLLHSLLLPDLWRKGHYLFGLAAPALLLVLVFQSGLRTRRALLGLRQANATLEGRVRAATAEIESANARQRELLAVQSTARERERIYRDLHDNLGAHLLGLVYGASDERQRGLARQALADMRMILAASQAHGGQLADLAREWALEAELRCEHAGMALDWSCQGDLLLQGTQHHHLEHIVRELVSNAIEHSGGRRVSVAIAAESDALWLRVCDDGRGMAVGTEAPGVRARVSKLQGHVAWEAAPGGGTCCHVSLPAPDPGAARPGEAA